VKIIRALGVTAAAAILGGAGWVALGGATQAPERRVPNLPYRAAGVAVSRVPPAGIRGGEQAHGRSGDFLVDNGRIAFVVGGKAPAPGGRSAHGVLLDLVSGKGFAHDELIDLRPVVRVAGKPLPLRVTETTLVTDAEFPFLRIEHVSQNGALRLVTDLLAPSGSRSIRLSTRLYNSSERLVRGIEVGDRTRWPGAATFAPRVGFPRLTSRAEVPWIARQGRALSYALAFPKGPVEATFFFDRIGQVGQETYARLGDVPPGGSLTFSRELIVVEGGLAPAAELAFRALGHKVGRVVGHIEPTPAWATIEARYPDGKPALAVRASADGKYDLPLPPGDYVLKLHAPGGEDEQRVHVEAGAMASAQLLAPAPGRLSFRITDPLGTPVPARVLVRGIAPTPDPVLGSVEMGSGVQNVLYLRDGVAEVDVRPGKYRVTVSRGPEYSLLDEQVEVSAAAGRAVHAVLERTVDTRGWIACDFHLHAGPSHDSNVSLEDRVLSLVAEGVEFAVATDHDHITDYAPAVERLEMQREIATARGIEITTLNWGHFNAYPLPLGIEPFSHSDHPPSELFAAVRARAPRAVIQVNHPRMPAVGYFNRIELDSSTGQAASENASLEFDAIEVVNGYDLEAPAFIQQNLREYFALLNFGRRYTATGSSDSHRLVINWAGYPRTYVRVPNDEAGAVDPNDVARAVLAGQVQVSNGIFLALAVNGTAGPGETVIGRRATISLEARAPSWVDVSGIELWVNGALVDTAPTPARREPAKNFVWHTELDLDRDSWIVVVARGERPMSAVFDRRRVLPFAFTNPVFVDADEDGVFTPPAAEEVAAVPNAAPRP